LLLHDVDARGSARHKISEARKGRRPEKLTMAATLFDKEKYLLSLVDAIVRMKRTPFPFLCAATMVEYLIKISGYHNADAYARFICDHFPVGYKDFQYDHNEGQRDLPQQMWYILRNGLVHSFSLFPDKKGQKAGARERSILITHRSAQEGRHLDHVRKISGGTAPVDAALFVLEDFCHDISGVIHKIFSDAAIDPSKEKEIHDNWGRSPPATWLGEVEP
jgi:hypothetical protein